MNWISVKDKLPENEMRVLAYGQLPECCSCQQNYEIMLCKYLDLYFIYGEYDCALVASHWMPLPDKPMNDNSEDIVEGR